MMISRGTRTSTIIIPSFHDHNHHLDIRSDLSSNLTYLPPRYIRARRHQSHCKMKLLALVTTVASLATQAAAWGQDGQSSCYANCPCLLSLTPAFVLLTSFAGHKIVATIAQVHLHPMAKQALCKILPPEAKCHLAPIAAWADQVRMRYRGTAPMHYVNGKSPACQSLRSVAAIRRSQAKKLQRMVGARARYASSTFSL